MSRLVDTAGLLGVQTMRMNGSMTLVPDFGNFFFPVGLLCPYNSLFYYILFIFILSFAIS